MKATVNQMPQYNIVHLATHAIFAEDGQPQNSLILFNEDKPATLSDVGTWDLSQVNLIVLSACETATSTTLGKGAPILGFGYQVQLARAKAAIASLWQVDDEGTQTLMDLFYALLKSGNLPPVEALRQAQIGLISGNYKALGQNRGGIAVEPTRGSPPPATTSHLSHPYYWAPFILIGNGL